MRLKADAPPFGLLCATVSYQTGERSGGYASLLPSIVLLTGLVFLLIRVYEASHIHRDLTAHIIGTAPENVSRDVTVAQR